jgi:hypothetical protein
MQQEDQPAWVPGATVAAGLAFYSLIGVVCWAASCI